jgi:uncharacterized protein
MPEKRTTQLRLDPRSPFVLDTRELGRRPGTMRKVRRSAPAPAGFGLELIGVPEGAPLDLDLRLEAVSEGVLVSGTVTAPVGGECGRCLDPIDDVVVVDVQELFAYPDSTTDSTASEEEVGRLQGDLVDLEPTVRDAVVLALPSTPLCRDECPGLCPECGARLDSVPAGHSHEQVDPRWDALRQLSEQEHASPANEPADESQE